MDNIYNISDNIDYANENFSIFGSFVASSDGGNTDFREIPYDAKGVFKRQNGTTFCSAYQLKGDGNHVGKLILFDYTLNGMPISSNETRPKSKFFNLLIYAGYPIA